ncbi:MAG: SprB repeat-containing protein [Raineya sp.]|nr:SprB repeat-containing protein [Raineya sp.]
MKKLTPFITLCLVFFVCFDFKIFAQRIEIKIEGFYSYARRNHSFVLSSSTNSTTTFNQIGCFSKDGGGDETFGLKVLFPELAGNIYNIPLTTGSLPADLVLKVDGWEDGRNAESCGSRCSFDNLGGCEDDNRSADVAAANAQDHWQYINLSNYAPGVWHAINPDQTTQWNYGVFIQMRYFLPGDVFQAPETVGYNATIHGTGHCITDGLADDVNWEINKRTTIPSVEGMTYFWEYRVSGAYTKPDSVICYNTCKIDSILTTDCLRYGMPTNPCYGADPITGELIEIPCDPICLRDTTYYVYTYDYYCNPYTCYNPAVTTVYDSSWIPVFSSSTSNAYSISDIFTLPSLQSHLTYYYNQGKVLLNPNIQFRVKGTYGSGADARTTNYSILNQVRVNWPPSAEITAPPTPTSNIFSNLSEATYESTQLRIENVKCFSTSTGKIIIKDITGQANGYYYSLRRTHDEDGDEISSGLTLNVLNKKPTPGNPVVFPDNADNKPAGLLGLPAGRYSLAIENYDAGGSNGSKAGCYKEIFNIKVQQPTLLEKQSFTKHTYNGFNVSCKGSADGKVSIQAKGGVTPYTYELIEDSPVFNVGTSSSGATSSPFEFSGLAAKDANGNTILYKLTIKDALGACEVIENFTLSEPTAPVDINNLTLSQFGTYNISCFGGVGSIQVLPKGGIETASYTVLLGSLSQTATTTAATTFTNLVAGTYTLIIRDANGCEKTQVVTLTEPPRISPTNALVILPTCYQGKDGKIESEATGGVPAVGGVYTFSLQRTAGNQPNSFYSYTDPTPQSQTRASFLALPEGTYKLRIQDQFSCQKDTTIIISEPTQLSSGVVDGTKKDVSCKGGSDGEAQVRFEGGSAPYQIEWSYNNTSSYIGIAALNSWGGTVETVSLGVTETHLFKNLKAGIYYVRFKDSKNCDNNIIGGVVTQFTIFEPNIALDASVNFNQQVSCFGGNDGSITGFATGGWVGSYQYSLDGGAFGLNNTFTGLSAGNHTLAVRDLQGCTKTVNFVITQPDQLTANLATSTNTSCFGGNDGSATLSISGGTMPYRVSLDGGTTWVLTDINSATAILTSLSAGAYNVYISDANNCSLASVVNVVITSPIAIAFQSAPVVTNTSCGLSDGAITVSITGGTPTYSYAWERLQGASYVAIAGNSNTLSNIFAGTYRVKVTDSRGCQWISSAIVVSDIGSPDMVNLQTTPVSCFGGNDGTISFEVTSGTAPYEWRLQGVTSFAPVTGVTTITGLKGGASNQHVIEIKGANGCTRPFVIEVPEPTPLAISFTPQNPLCVGASNGSITATVSGGNGGYTYEWLGFTTTTATLNNITAGTYTLKVKDNKGCEFSKEVSLTDPLPTKVSFPDTVRVCGGNAYTVDAGNSGSTYEWKNANGEVIGTNQTIAISQMGNYTLKIKTALGCESTHPFRLEVRDDLVKADVLSTAEAIAEDTVVFIDISRVLVDDPNNPSRIPDRIEWVYDSPNIVRVGGYAGYTEELQFLKEGFYTIKLRAFYTSCSSEIEKSIVILPKAAKNATQNGLGYQGADVTEFTAFPNPSAGTFQAQVKLNKIAPVTISLYSLQESRSLVTYQGDNQQDYLFDFTLREDIPAGIYALMVVSPNETRFFRVVIQK